MAHHSTVKSPFKFKWLGSGTIPEAFDLQRHGWHLESVGTPTIGCIGLVNCGESHSGEWERMMSIPEQIRRFVLVVGAPTALECSRLLKANFGEVVTDSTSEEEFIARAVRLAEMTRWLPRHRRIGELELDLLAREAFGHNKALNLNPREFALLWRLADKPGKTVSKMDLIQDVWRMGFIPETNSIAVHMSRLRRKLSFVGLNGVITTAPSGGYFLNPPSEFSDSNNKTRAVA